MSNDATNKIITEIVAEYQRAISKFPTFHSDREGFDILDEEVQELKQAIRHGTPEQARAEAIQVAAMALRLVRRSPSPVRGSGTMPYESALIDHATTNGRNRPDFISHRPRHSAQDSIS